MVCEFCDSKGEWQCFLSDLIPEIIDDEVKKVQADWVGALRQLTPEELFELIPVTYPKMNAVRTPAGFYLPGVSKFPVNQWIADDYPVLGTAGWCKLAMKVAGKDSAHLDEVFRAGRLILSTL